MERFDTHTHVISTDVDKYPLDPLGGQQSVWSEKRPVTAEQLLAAMKQAGVQKAVAVQAATNYGFDNNYVADVIEKYPAFVGVASADFLSDRSVEILKYLIDDRGFVGVRLRAADGATPVPKQGEGIDDPLTMASWAFVEERQVPVCIQMHAKELPQLKNLLAKFPNLIIALDHSGRPQIEGGAPYKEADAFFELSAHGGVYLKITTVALKRFAEAPGGSSDVLRALIDHFGADHLAWGSNFPASEGALAELVSRAEGLFKDLTDAERQMVFSGTAKKIYPKLA